MIIQWLRTRHIHKHSAHFWALLQAEDSAAALEYFAEHLAEYKTEVSRATRAVYHFQRWLAYRNAVDAQALKVLAQGAAPHDPVLQAWKLLEQMRGLSELAHAIEQVEPGKSRAAALTQGPLPSQDYEKVALAIQATHRLHPQGRPGETPEEERRGIAHEVLQLLPRGESTPDGCAAIVALLLAWAALVRRDYAIIQAGDGRLQTLAPELHKKILLAAAFGWGRDSLLDGRIVNALEAQQWAVAVAGPETGRQFILAWGLHGLRQRQEALQQGQTPEERELQAALCKWLAHQVNHFHPEDPASWRQSLVLAYAVALFQGARHSQGRQLCAQLEKALASSPRGIVRDRTLSVCLFLSAACLLAGTVDWGAPRPGSTPEIAEENRQQRVKNRALWGEVHDQLLSLVERLVECSVAWAWRGHLFKGLIAYVDSRSTLSMEQLAQFSAAVEQVKSDAARTRLKTIEGALVARAKATEEAIALLRRNDLHRLREHQAAVLAPLGDVIPSLVRAAVCLALWQADPSLNAVGYLQRLPLQPAEESLIGACIAQVRNRQTLDQLRDACTCPDPTGRVLPALDLMLAQDPQSAELVTLAAAAIRLRQGQCEAARELLAGIPGGQEQRTIRDMLFYAAWRQNDIPACRELAAGDEPLGLLARHEHGLRGLGSRSVIWALEENKSAEAATWFMEAVEAPLGSEAALPALVRMVVWLIDRDKPRLAQVLLEWFDRAMARSGAPAATVDWTLTALNCLVSARLGQYTACIESARRLLALGCPEAAPFSPPESAGQIVQWCRLISLEAELALAATASDDLKTRWGVTQRSMLEQTAALEEEPAQQPYAFLIGGFLAYLSTYRLIDEGTVERLRKAQRMLEVGRRAPFIEEAIGRLNWRMRVIEDFWGGLRDGNFKDSRRIYNEELLPALRDRIPHSIQLGMVMADWESGACVTADLLARLDLLQFEAPELGIELLQEVRDYIQDGEKVRRIIELMKQKQFDELIELINEVNWTGLDPGAMPVPVAITLLYAYFKTQRNEEAIRMGEGIGQSTNLASWVRDEGLLLLGYVLFREQKYPDAAKAFEKVGVSQVLCHDVDKYWAAAKFSFGLQLLAIDKKKDAFDAFASSLQKRKGARENVSLAPLFIHFGLKSIDARNGNRAKHAFALMAEGLENAPDTPEIFRYRLFSDVGFRLCRSLIDEDIRELGGDQFLELAQRLDKSAPLPEEENRRLRRLLQILAICQELRRQRRSPRETRMGTAELRHYLGERVLAIGELDGVVPEDKCDPTLLTLECLLAILDNDKKKALALFPRVQRLGVHAPRLMVMMEALIKAAEAKQKNITATLDLFDLYLANGEIPHHLRDQFVREDDLAVLYHLHRNYLPGEVMADEVLSATALLRKRFEHLANYLDSAELKDDRKLKQLHGELGQLVDKIENAERELEHKEREIMGLLAEKVRLQALESV